MDVASANLSNQTWNANRTCIPDLETFLTPYLRWLVPVMVVAGVVGNGFILIIFSSKGMRTKTHFILSAMAAVNLAHALAAMATNMYLYERIIDSEAFSRFYHLRMKPTLMVLVNWLAMTSTWLAVLCTIERFIAIRYPLKAHMMIRKRIIVVATCGIAAFSFLICSYYAFLLRGITAAVSCEQNNRMLYRLAPDPSLRVYGHVARQVHSLLCSVVPIALLFYYNGSLVYYLRRNRDPTLQKLANGPARTKRPANVRNQSQRAKAVRIEDNREHKVAFVVLAITLTTAFLLSPSALVVIYDAVRYTSSMASGLPITTPRWYFHVGDISNTLVMLEKVLDFFLYCFASGAFRRRLVAMFFTRPSVRRSTSLCRPRRLASSAVYRSGSTQYGDWIRTVKYHSLARVQDGVQLKLTSADDRYGARNSKLPMSVSDNTDCESRAQRRNQQLITTKTIWSVQTSRNAHSDVSS